MTVFFLSDYGEEDEFAGIVRAVIRQSAPSVTVLDLSHGIRPFDVRAGARLLARAMPSLGGGVVLGVVDPGVGGPRRGIVIETAPKENAPQTGQPGPRFLVGPDNGLLIPAARLAGIASVRAIERFIPHRPPASGKTFDGRDLFGPTAAALAAALDESTGTPDDRAAGVFEALGPVVEEGSLEVPADPVVEVSRLADGRRKVRAEVTWVDRFGNIEVAAPAAEVPIGVAVVGVSAAAHTETPSQGVVGLVRRVEAFVELEAGEIGLLHDAYGSLALVVKEGSAAERTGLREGDLVELVW